MFVERNLVLDLFEDHARALQAHVNANVERKVWLRDVIGTVRELLESGLHIRKSPFSVKVAKLKQKVARLTDLVNIKGLERQTMSRQVEDAGRLQEEPTKVMWDKNRLSAQNMVLLALETKTLE